MPPPAPESSLAHAATPGGLCATDSEPAPARPVAPSGGRMWEFDALRGLMLVLMTLTHLPTRLSNPTSQPFGFVSAAEGFVLLSAFMAGMVYTTREHREGGERMARAFWQRAVKIYLAQAALLVFLFTIVALIAAFTHQPAVQNLMGFYLENPRTAIVNALLLIYNPPLLDILPMYVLFMLASPIVLLHGRQRGWTGIMSLSVVLWVAAQFDLGQVLYDAMVLLFGLKVPFPATGSFEIFGWQFLWVLGLWMGSRHADAPDAPPIAFPRWMVNVAIALFIVGVTWRHAIGQAPFPGQPSLNLMFDKWHLGPLRVINFFALLVLVLHFAPRVRLPRLKPLEVLGTASLPVFCAHLVCALLALAIAGEVKPGRPMWIDLAILGVSFAVMYAVAAVSNELDRRAARVRQQMKNRRAARLDARRARPA